MNRKKGNFIEEHIEKAVLAIAVLLSVFLVFKFVIIPPNVFPFGGSTLSAARIDVQISDEAQKLKKLLNDDSARAAEYESFVEQFIARMQNPLGIDADILWPIPTSVEMKADRKYSLPRIPVVQDVAVEHIRAVAYVPNREITIDNAKEQTAYEPDDMDLVTVQAGFDMSALINAFETSFAGDDLPENWRDPQLAKPVFAAVDLQRQEQISGGDWSQWQSVPRTRIDPQKETFRVIENVKDLPSGSVMVRLLRLGQPKVQAALLQPEPYQIASAEEEWYPPVLHRKFLKSRSEREAQERREQLETLRAQQEQERDKGRSTREQRRPKASPAGGGGDDYMKMMMMGDAASSSTRTSTRTRTRTELPSQSQLKTPVKPDIETEIYDEMKEIVLSDKEITDIREMITLWAHDDTVEPGKTYRYRIRLGVFNPVAGTKQLADADTEYENNVVLWSGFSDITETAHIPKRVYFFPVAVQEAAKNVEVQVYSYALGYWYNQQFNVKRGDLIGKTVKLEQTKPATSTTDKNKVKPLEDDKNLTLPETVDYTTDAMVVDVVVGSAYTGDRNLQQQSYYDMLYSFDGTNIERLPANLMLWPDELKAKHAEIKAAEKKPKLALRAWNPNQTIGGTKPLRNVPSRTAPGQQGGPGGPNNEDMMYIMMMMGGQGQ